MLNYNEMKNLILDRTNHPDAIIKNTSDLCIKILNRNPSLTFLNNLFMNLGEKTHFQGYYGEIVSLNANKEHFKTSVTVKLEDYENDDERNYKTVKLTDEFGNPVINFLDKKDLKVQFYSMEEYIILKLAIQRLSEEATFIYKQMKEMKEQGFTLELGSPRIVPDYKKKGKRNLTVKCFMTEFDHKEDFENDFISYKSSNENLMILNRIRNLIVYKLNPTFNFISRCMDFDLITHIEHNMSKWETDFKLPRKRITWNRRELPTLNVDWRFRTWAKNI